MENVKRCQDQRMQQQWSTNVWWLYLIKLCSGVGHVAPSWTLYLQLQSGLHHNAMPQYIMALTQRLLFVMYLDRQTFISTAAASLIMSIACQFLR